MKKVIVYGQDPLDTIEICSQIEEMLPYEVMNYHRLIDLKEFFQANSSHLIVMSQDKYGDDSEEFIQKVRQMGHQMPVLVVLENLLQSMANYQKRRVHYLLKPFPDKDLVGIVKKLIQSKEIPQQKFKRYNTNEMAFLESFNQAGNMSSQLYNLSQGGAYVEYGDNETQTDSVVVGDIVKVKVDLNNMSSQHALNAKVVWRTRKGSYSGRQGAGLKFVNSEEIYRDLLDRT